MSELIWEGHRQWGYYQEIKRRLKIKITEYDPDAPKDLFRYELHEMNTPATRAAGERSLLLKRFHRIDEAQAYANTLSLWSKAPDTSNGWLLGPVRVVCKRVSHMPARMLDDKRRLWSIYIDDECASSHNNGKAAQAMAEQIFEADRSGLIEE